MSKDIIILNGIILFYILQRVGEMFISKSNEIWLKKNNHAIEVDEKESLRMKIFHTLWFITLLIEANIKKDMQSPLWAIYIYLVLGFCLFIRLHTMENLKQFWTIKIFKMENQNVSTKGLYQYIRHPNYLVVVLEFIFIPLLFKAYFTLFIFSFLNIFVLINRIKLEERTLMSQTNYQSLFANKKRFLPFVLVLIFFVNITSFATDLVIHHDNYTAAQKAPNYVKFESTSTKLGFITTSFDGQAKDIKINYSLDKNILSKLELIIPVKSLDTDSNARNEKMLKEILEAEKYPDIIVTIPNKIALTEGEHEVEMIFAIKDKKTAKMVKYKISKVENKFHITGETQLGLKELSLPDPSIAIAKVRDLFDLKFAVDL